jgi:hypothetical protein
MAPNPDAANADSGDAARDAIGPVDASPADSSLPDTVLPDVAPGLDSAADRSALVDGATDGNVVEAAPMDTTLVEAAAPMDTTPVEAAAPMDVEAAAPFCASRSNAADAGVLQRLCYEFTDPAQASDFAPEAGTWTVSNGSYLACGPVKQVTCSTTNGSQMTASVLRNLIAQDVRVHAKMTSVDSPDKLLVLRSRPGGNRIELNFRAKFVDDADTPQGGELYIDGLVDCANPIYVTVGVLPLPHVIGQAIVADVQLIGQHLTVVVDGKTVFDNTLPQLPTAPGSVGVAVFLTGQAQFDDFLVEVLK